MPFIKFDPKNRIKGSEVLYDIEGGSFSVIPGPIYIISERHLRILDEKRVKYELLGRGVLRLNGNRATIVKPKRKSSRPVGRTTKK